MKIDEQIYLEHFGVKGMRWKQRNAARQKNRELNRASRQKDAEDWPKEVDTSRASVKSKASRNELKQPKRDYAKNKQELGSREASKILYEAREKRMETVNTSRQARDGKEHARKMFIGAAVGVTMHKVLQPS